MKSISSRSVVASAVALALGAAAVPAVAAEPGMYAVVGVDSNKAEAAPPEMGAGASTNLDKKSTGYSVGLGFRVTPNIAAEFNYIDFGWGHVDVNGAPRKFKVYGGTASVIGIWPITESWSVDVRGGVYHGQSQLQSEWGGLAAFDYQDPTTSFLFGAGGAFAFSPNVELHLGYVSYRKAMFSRDDMNQMSLSLRFSF